MRSLLVLLVLAFSCQGAQKSVAITIDDLPRGGDGPCELAAMESMTRKLLEPFRNDKIPVTGFVNEGRCDLDEAALKGLLTLWLDAGADLGNHTSGHISLNKATVAEFEEQIMKGERLTRPLLKARGRELRYLRHPFLHVGLTLDKRREAEKMMASHAYAVAPVTVDNSDYLFAVVYADARRKGNHALAARVLREYVPYMESVFEFFERRAVVVTGREIPQILLLHANELNAEAMPELLAMMRRRAYSFSPLSEVMKDPVWSEPDTYAGPGGFSWIHHWSKTKGMKGQGEPEEPAWIREEAEKVARSKP